MKVRTDRIVSDIKSVSKLGIYAALIIVFIASILFALHAPYNAVQYLDGDNHCVEKDMVAAENYSGSGVTFESVNVSPEFTSVYSSCSMSATMTGFTFWGVAILAGVFLKELLLRYIETGGEQ